MSRPLARGDLWRELRDRYNEKLIVIVSADNLRSEDAQISEGLSWENAVDDLVSEVQSNPAVRGLQVCRHLVITLRSDAASLLDPSEMDAEGNVRSFSIASAPYEDTLIEHSAMRVEHVLEPDERVHLGAEVDFKYFK